MKKTLLVIIPSLFVSIVPMIGAYIYVNGPEWVRLMNGYFLFLSCTFVMVTIAIGTFYYIMESE